MFFDQLQNNQVVIILIKIYNKSQMSVKVAVRVRPFNEREINIEATSCIQMVGNQTIITNPSTEIIDEAKKNFSFDYSFWSHDGYKVRDDGVNIPQDNQSSYADQIYLYEKLGKQVLANAWEGFHCCLFAYGQTGSGKSYSMVGYGKNEGIVPMVCNELFKRINFSQDQNVKFEVQVSMLEIYNERVQDLLIKKERPPGGLKVREKQGEIYVQNLSKHAVNSYQSISKKMEEGYTNRSIGATSMNQTSSRAHTIITIEFKQIQEVEDRKIEKYSRINLVDLAGSEKVGQIGSEGQSFKEGCAINKSLSVLGNCINVLADKASGKQSKAVVPYRDSILTRILQNALGGNSKTIMICAISPASVNYEESLSTLRYADRAKKIVNKAVVNENTQDKLIRSLQEENEQLKRDLQKLPANNMSMASQKNAQEEIKKAMHEAEQKIKDIERSWEDKLRLQKLKDDKEQQAKLQQIKDKKAPHLTNLNQDSQLTGKLYFGLMSEKNQTFTIGRNQKSSLVLKGVGIQDQHAQIKVDEYGNFILSVQDSESQQNTLVNGKHLSQSKSNQNFSINVNGLFPDPESSCTLNHMDRLCFGVGSIFLFKYPLQKHRKHQVLGQIQQSNPSMEPEEIEAQVDQYFKQNGITQNQTFTCEDYSEDQIRQDDDATLDCFEYALNEVQQATTEREKTIIIKAQMQFTEEKNQIQQQFRESFSKMKQAEEQKVTELKEQQDELEKSLIEQQQKMQLMKELTEQQQQQQLLLFEESAKNKVNKSEVQKVQDQLERVQKQINWQKELNAQILKEHAIKMVKQMQEQTSMVDIKRRQSTMRSEQSIEHSNIIQKIVEASKICKMLKLNIKFKLMFVQSFGSNLQLLNFKENKQEVQIQVQNIDKGGAISIWTEQQLDDKIAMMRDGLAELEQEKQIEKETPNDYTLNSFRSEIFEDQIQDADDLQFDNQLLSAVFQNLNGTLSSKLDIPVSTISQDLSKQFFKQDFAQSMKDIVLPMQPAATQKDSEQSSLLQSRYLNLNEHQSMMGSTGRIFDVKQFKTNVTSVNESQYEKQQDQAAFSEWFQPQNEVQEEKKEGTLLNDSSLWQYTNSEKESLQSDIKQDEQLAVEYTNVQSKLKQMQEQHIHLQEPQNLRKTEPPPIKQTEQSQAKVAPYQEKKSIETWNKQQQSQGLLQKAQKQVIKNNVSCHKSGGDSYKVVDNFNFAKDKHLAQFMNNNVFQTNVEDLQKINLTGSILEPSSSLYINMNTISNQILRSETLVTNKIYQQKQNSMPVDNFLDLSILEQPQDVMHIKSDVQSQNETRTLKTTDIFNESSVNLLGFDNFEEVVVNKPKPVKVKQEKESKDDLFWMEEYQMNQEKPNLVKIPIIEQQQPIVVPFQPSFAEQSQVLQQQPRLTCAQLIQSNYSPPNKNTSKEASQEPQKQNSKGKETVTEQERTNFKIKQSFLWDILSYLTHPITLKKMFLKPIPPQVRYLQCTIERNKNGLNKLFPVYYLKLSEGNKYIMTADKIANSATSHYKITIGQSRGDNIEEYLGRLRSNFKSTHFYLYGEGVRQSQVAQSNLSARKQYGTIIYSENNALNKKEDKSMRFFEAYIPMVHTKDLNVIRSWPDVDDCKKESIKDDLNDEQEKEKQSLHKKQNPRYLRDIIYFVSKTDQNNLSFQGRNSWKSEKNFQLSDKEDSNKIFLHFGRAGPNIFNMDVAYPFSLYQAFAICLSTFDRQW